MARVIFVLAILLAAGWVYHKYFGPPKIAEPDTSQVSHSLSEESKQARQRYEEYIRVAKTAKSLEEVFPFVLDKPQPEDPAMEKVMLEMMNSRAAMQIEFIEAVGNEEGVALKYNVLQEDVSLFLSVFVFMQKHEKQWMVKSELVRSANRNQKTTARQYFDHVTYREPASVVPGETVRPFQLGQISMPQGGTVDFDKKQLSLWAFDFVKNDIPDGEEVRTRIRIFDSNRKLLSSAQSVCFGKRMGSGGSMSFDFPVEKVDQIKFFSYQIVECAGGF